MSTRRFPASVYSRGSEPDARFSLANERTFLAWIRTALALLAGGVALELLGPAIHPDLRLAASLLLIVAGAAVPCLAWVSWMQNERALRLAQPLPSSVLGTLIGITVAAVGALVLLAILFA